MLYNANFDWMVSRTSGTACNAGRTTTGWNDGIAYNIESSGVLAATSSAICSLYMCNEPRNYSILAVANFSSTSLVPGTLAFPAPG